MATTPSVPSDTGVSGKAGENALKTTLNEPTPAPEVPPVAAEAAKEDVRDVEVNVRKDGKPRKRPVTVQRHVIGPGSTDTVYLSRCEYESVRTRKSLTVHHLQRRLEELGYVEAGADIDGWYSALTASAVAKFKADHDISPADGKTIDAETFTLIFEGDSNVTVSHR